MSSNYLALRSSAAPTFTVSTLLAKSISIQSTTISLGQSTNQSYTNFSNGSFTTGWASTLTGLTSIKDVVLSPNGSVQTILQNSGSTMSTVITSANSGITWAGSTMRGLPTSGALPYQTYGSTINAMPVPSITAITAAPSGTNQLAIASNELVYASANSGATFAATGLGQNNSPFIYIPFDGSVTDVMGNATVTATGSPAYVAGKVGTNALNLINTLNGTTPAAQYVRFPWVTAPPAFTVSFWFNSQTPVSSVSQILFSSYNFSLYAAISTAGYLYTFFPTGSGTANTIVTNASILIAANTWYNVVYVFQTNGTCSLYLNNSLIGSMTNSGGFGGYASSGIFSIGCPDMTLVGNSFNGYIDDFRLYNYAVTNPSGAALINPLVGPIMPFVYLTFDGSTTTDLMGNSTTTATGSPGVVAGQIGSNALDLSTNTAGGTATKNISGTWAGTSNFTVSGWFNAQAIPASSVGMIFSAGTGAATAFQVHITTGGVLTIYSNAAYATSTITTNIWYFFQVVYQSSGTCYVYLNGTQVTTFAGTTLSPIPTTFNIGTYTHTAAVGAFRGYIDDIRIYNGAFLPSQLSPVLYSPSYAVGSPNIYLPFENGSVLDVMGYSAVSARGTMNFVPGVVGSSALNLVNPSGGTAVNYVRGSWAGAANFTVSFWINPQALGGSQLQVFAVYGGNCVVYISSSNQLGWYMPTGGGGAGLTMGITSFALSINTWYYVTIIFQTNGLCSFYVNNALISTYTNVSGVGTLPSTQFGIGCNDNATFGAFNGYIDDFKLYNSAVPFSALGPMNYTQAAISNSGNYQVVAAANGGVYTSANSGSTWSQALTSPQPAPAVNTVGGQVITPNLTGLAAYTWTQNGVNWAASASTTLAGGIYDAYRIFNNTSDSNSRWVPSSASYNTAGNSSGVSNMILGGVSSQTGDWLQIQSSVPLVMSSYQFTTGPVVVRLPKTYYITGSNDGSNWYPLQYGNGGAVTNTATYTLVPGVILINSTSTQIFGSSTIATTAFSTSTNAYTYFRLVILASYNSSADYIDIGEWNINFATPSTPLYVAPSTALIANQSLNAITVMPQQTGLASNTWTTNGVSWVASASATYNGSTLAYCAFNNSLTSVSWAGAASAYRSTSPYDYTANTYSTAILGGVGTIAGDWLQLQTSAPVVMSSYTWQSSGTAQQPKNYYIIGSNDGTNWYPIQYALGNTTPFTAGNQLCTSYLLVTTTTITQTIQGGQAGSFTTTGYPTSTNSYTYFRLVVTANWGYQNGNTNVGQWFINFTAYTPALLQSLSMSPSGQYMALTGAGAVAPHLTGLAANTWTANGVNWTVSASSYNTAYYPYYVFNNGTSSEWITGTNVYSSSGNTASFSTTVQGGVGTITGDWLQLQSSVPLVMSSYQFATGYINARLPKTYYIVGSNDGTTWYPIQYGAGGAVTTSSTFAVVAGTIFVYSTGAPIAQTFGSSTITTTAYSTAANAYTYFRLICVTSYSASADYITFTEWHINFQSGPTFYSTDYGSSWTRSLTAATIPNANVLATSGNGQYSFQASGQTVIIANNTSGGNPTGAYTTPTFSPALTVNPVSNAAVSASGQYMVVLIQSTTNNVYYSSNYGVSFTGITLGSTAMVSCAVSADGSYITVANATQVFTLNSNTQGLSITVGNQSGLINQGQNAVAIGNQAGQINQSANSIVLNSSGTAVNAHVPGFFVAPVQSAGSSVSGSFAVLGYGTDSQVVQTGVSIRADGNVMANGNVGIGVSAINAQLQFASTITNRKIVLWDDTLNSDHQYYGFGINPNILRYQVPVTSANHVFYAGTSTATSNELMRIMGNGNVGIGTANPTSALQVSGTVTANLFSTQIQSVGAFSSTNAFTITIPYPASYIFSVNGNSANINSGAGDAFVKAIIYVTIGASGVVLTTVVQSVGVQINSYNTSNQQLSYNIGFGGGTINGGGVCTVSVMRLV